MIIAYKEATLVLKVKMGGEAIGTYLVDDFLFQLLVENLLSFIQLF